MISRTVYYIMDRLLRLGGAGMGGMGGSAPPSDTPAVDTAEQE